MNNNSMYRLWVISVSLCERPLYLQRVALRRVQRLPWQQWRTKLQYVDLNFSAVYFINVKAKSDRSICLDLSVLSFRGLKGQPHSS